MLCLYVCYCFGIPTGSAYDLHHLGKIRMNLGFTKQQYGPHVFFLCSFFINDGQISTLWNVTTLYTCNQIIRQIALWRHRMETFSALLALCVCWCVWVCVFVCVCVWLRPVAAELWCFLWSPPRCSEKPRCCWFHTLSRSSWRHCNEAKYFWPQLRSALPVAVPAQQSCINRPSVGEAHVCTCFDKKSLPF